MLFFIFFRLDVSENQLDVELASVVNGVTRNKYLQSLNISKNLPKIKARDVAHVMDAIVQLVQVSVQTFKRFFPGNRFFCINTY